MREEKESKIQRKLLERCGEDGSLAGQLLLQNEECLESGRFPPTAKKIKV